MLQTTPPTGQLRCSPDGRSRDDELPPDKVHVRAKPSTRNLRAGEELVLSKTREIILDDENLKLLTSLVNAELGTAQAQADDDLREAERGLQTLRMRLQRNHEALETGSIDLGILAPRMRELRGQIVEAERARDILIEPRRQQHAAVYSLESILPYAAKLRETLRIGSFKERKTFLVGMIDRIVVEPDSIEIKYRLPMEESRTGELFSPVLQSVTSGGASATLRRTFQLSVPFWGTEGATNSRRSAAEKGR